MAATWGAGPLAARLPMSCVRVIAASNQFSNGWGGEGSSVRHGGVTGLGGGCGTRLCHSACCALPSYPLRISLCSPNSEYCFIPCRSDATPFLHPSSLCVRVQDGEGSLDTVSSAFARLFPKPEQFKAGCAISVLLEDNLLTNTQAGIPSRTFMRAL